MRLLTQIATALSLTVTVAAPLQATAQTAESGAGTLLLGADYSWVHTNILPGCNCVQLNGGGLQMEAGFLPHLAAVADLNIAHASGITPDGYTLTQTVYGFGLRYLPLSSHSRFQPFGEGLLGGAYASGSLAPDRTGFGRSTAMAVQAGGGLRISVGRRLGRRLFVEPIRADYLYTTFGNGAARQQNDTRLSAGILIRLNRP
jgi:hypothetical protein